MATTLTEDEFIQALERANKGRFDDPGWEFNEPQEQAIRYGEGPLWVIAGPGSGKTEVLVSRALLLLLVRDVDPESIMLTTFTRKAAQGLEERIMERVTELGYDDEVDPNRIRIGTLHQLCDEIMGDYTYEEYGLTQLLDDAGQDIFIRQESDFTDLLAGNDVQDEWDAINDHIDALWMEFQTVYPQYWFLSEGNDPNKIQAAQAASQLLNRVSQYRTEADKLQTSDDVRLRILGEAVERHRETLAEESRCDFARIQEIFLDFLDSESGDRFVNETSETPALEHMLIDEYQDTNPLQQEIYFQLAAAMNNPNITVVGDDDQALYRFRGSTVECLIEFQDRITDRLSLDLNTVGQVQLKTNYRSTPEIVEWCNRYIDNQPLMNEPGARAPGKDPMFPNRSTSGRASVALLDGGSEVETAQQLAGVVSSLRERDYIDDYSQVALIFRSTRELTDSGNRTFVGECVHQLEDVRGIDVYNPRNKSFLQQPEIQLALYAMVRCMDPGLEYGSNLWGQIPSRLDEWEETFEAALETADDNELKSYISDWENQVRDTDAGASLGATPLELFLELVTFQPLSGWISSDPARAQRLGQLSEILDSFLRTTTLRYLEKSTRDGEERVATRLLGDFYYVLISYLNSVDLDDPEDPFDQIPAGHVQVMTTHQAKGLEFPIVCVGDLDSDPRSSRGANTTQWLEDLLAPYSGLDPIGTQEERAARDTIRRYYVSYSRAEDHLVLLDTGGDLS
jgi:superfamily I DNA/RNA helicase